MQPPGRVPVTSPEDAEWGRKQNKEAVNLKNGKKPTLEQKRIMRCHGLVPDNWLVVRNLPDSIEVVSRLSLKKIGTGRPRTRILSRDI